MSERVYSAEHIAAQAVNQALKARGADLSVVVDGDALKAAKPAPDAVRVFDGDGELVGDFPWIGPFETSSAPVVAQALTVAVWHGNRQFNSGFQRGKAHAFEEVRALAARVGADLSFTIRAPLTVQGE